MYKLLLLFFLSFLSISSSVYSSDYQSIENSLRAYEKKIQTLQQNIDNSVFNDTEILLKLDFETDQIVAFVQDKISFQPYQGLLRGVQGTINSRAGNALDQSVLLAKLLNDAGLEARIATGQLTDQLTLQLLSDMSNPEIPEHIGQGVEFENALKAFTPKNHSKVNWKETETYARYTRSLEDLSKTLKKNNIVFKNTDITAQLIQQNKEYFWVQYRSNPTDAWHDAHPSFNQAFSKSTEIKLKAIEHFQGSVPNKYHHLLKIEAFIEQRVGKSIKQHSLMKPWIAPIANLQDKLITYTNAPSGTNIKSDYDLAEVLKKSSFFIPTFNGTNAGGKVFDLKGRLVDAFAMGTPAGALFQTLGDKTLSAVDKLSNKDPNKETMQLISQWLEFTFIYPDGTQYVQKRYIYQAPSNQKIDDMTVKTQLISEYSLLVNSGEKPNAYLANVYINLVESGLPLLNSSSNKVFNPEQKVGFPKKINRNEFELLTQYHWMQQNPDKNKGVIQFRSHANLLGFKRGYVNPETAFLAVDVISNKQEFLQKQDGKFFTNPKAAFTHGVWETASEWMPAKISGISGNSIDTLKVSSAAHTQNIPMRILKPQLKNKDTINEILENDKMASYQIDKNFTDKIRSDLDLGYSIVMPSEIPKGLKMHGWWRINLETGETLGMLANGGGSEMTEYLIQNAQTALSLIRAVGNLKKCEEKTNDLEKLCCLAEAHFNNVAGIPFGAALGGALGTAGAALFDIADFTAEVATGSGIAPSTGGKLCAGIDFPDF